MTTPAAEVVIIATIIAAAGRRDQLLHALQELLPAARAEAGVDTFLLHENRDSPGHFTLYERFRDQAAVDAHFASPHFARIGAALAEHADGAPVLTYHRPLSQDGAVATPETPITESAFTARLITMRSKKSFADVTADIERLFQPFDLDKLRMLAAAGDAEKFTAYAKQVDGPTGFGMFFQLDMGALMRPAEIALESKLYLIGSVLTGQGLFRYSGVAGLGAPVRFCVSQRDGEDTRIDIDRPTSFHSQFPELSASAVPAEKDARMLPLLARAAGLNWPDL